ncbi:putative T7SS-secreted protein [Streptomyces sp. NPDC053069]|uniref:putative T7SS-secreted protein n=1 Tax=Streptomyces sp. NPDC053069 TaxID=3365695 RepID=UPI0037CE1638
MASELGSTSDPKDLIPGDPEKLTGLATTLTGWSKKFEKIGDGLRDLKIPGWTGQASDVFWPTLAKEKTNWYLASDAMSGAADQTPRTQSLGVGPWWRCEPGLPLDRTRPRESCRSVGRPASQRHSTPTS